MAEDKKVLYKQIVDYLIDMIKSNKILQGEKLPTEAELMEKFNVSRITAKRALEELKNMGLIYRKKGQGSFLNDFNLNDINSRSKVVSMVIPYENANDGFIDYVKGASDYLYSKGYLLSINCTDGDELKERKFLINIDNIGVCGMIYYPTSKMGSFDILSTLYMREFPMVLLDKYTNSIPLSYSVSDNYDGGYRASQHLIQLGHKNIAFMSSVDIGNVSSIRDRFWGYCKALKDNSLIINNEFIISKFSHERLSDHLKKLLSLGVTAIVAQNDYIAFDIIKAADESGISIPDDISLVGFDNIKALQHIGMSLTTIEQDFYNIGKKAAKKVIEIIEGNGGVQAKEVTPIKLITGNSTIKISK